MTNEQGVLKKAIERLIDKHITCAVVGPEPNDLDWRGACFVMLSLMGINGGERAVVRDALAALREEIDRAKPWDDPAAMLAQCSKIDDPSKLFREDDHE